VTDCLLTRRVVLWPDRRLMDWKAEPLPEASVLNINYTDGTAERRLFWISLQKDKSISVGTSDRNFKVRRISEDGSALDGDDQLVARPHISFHPSKMLSHLTGDRGSPIAQGVTFADCPPDLQEYPWVYFRSSPLRNIKPTGSRSGQGHKVDWSITTIDDGLSVLLSLFYVRSPALPYTYEATASRYIKWGGVFLRVNIAFVPPGETSLRLFW
jgi:hypothetical protein